MLKLENNGFLSRDKTRSQSSWILWGCPWADTWAKIEGSLMQQKEYPCVRTKHWSRWGTVLLHIQISFVLTIHAVSLFIANLNIFLASHSEYSYLNHRSVYSWSVIITFLQRSLQQNYILEVLRFLKYFATPEHTYSSIKRCNTTWTGRWSLSLSETANIGAWGNLY